MNICLFISNYQGIQMYKYLINNCFNIKLLILNKLHINRFDLSNNTNIIIYNKNNLNPLINALIDNNIDLGITYYFPILSERIFSIPYYGIINVHYSLLYSYQGPDPVEWQLYNNEKETGVSVHFITNKIDQGDIIVQEKIKIPNIKIFVHSELDKLSKLCLRKAILLIKKYGKNVPIIKSKYKKSYYGYFN